MEKYKCIKSVSVGEQDTSQFKTEVFTSGTEYDCIDGFITDNIGVKRSIDKPKFKEHFELIDSLDVDNGEIIKPNAAPHSNVNDVLGQVIEKLTAELSRYEAGFKRIEQLANESQPFSKEKMYNSMCEIVSVCNELKRPPKQTV